MRIGIFAAVFIVLLFSGLLLVSALQPRLNPGDSWPDSLNPEDKAEPKKFSSYSQLEAFLERMAQRGYVERQAVFTATVTQAAGAADSAPSFSRTNIQVEGVDEADVVKTDGRYIYLVSSGRVFIILAYPAEEARILSTINVQKHVHGLYVNGDRLAIFSGGEPSYYVECLDCGVPNIWAVNTTVRVYNIEDRTNPVKVREVTADGWYLSSRMLGDYVYLIVNSPAVVEPVREGVQRHVVTPTISSGSHVVHVPATDIYYTNVTDYGYMYTVVVSVNVKNPDEEPKYTTVLTGASGVTYVSKQNIYLAGTRWVVPLAQDAEPSVRGVAVGSEMTVVVRLAIEGPNVNAAAIGEVRGMLLNQFSMDEYNGHLRVATTSGGFSPQLRNNVYLLNMSLDVVGKLEGLAPGERIYSVRFMGERGYVVTFKKVDPLFVLDLSDPADPSILGQLKITGYSDYLHPYDEKHLIGIGKEAVPADQGDFAWYQGLKMGLFDVSDVSKPKEKAKLVLGDRGTDSPIFHDHKAFLFDRDRGLLVIPVLLAVIDREKYGGEVPPDTYGDFIFQGVYVFSVSPDEGIIIRGRVTHLPDDSDLLRSGYNFESDYTVWRALYIGDVLYTISLRKVMMNSITSLEKLAEVELPKPDNAN